MATPRTNTALPSWYAMHRRLLVVLVALALTAAACGAGSADKPRKPASARTTTTESVDSDESTTSSTGGAATAGVTTTTKRGTTTTAAKAAGAPSPSHGPGPNAAPAPAAPGTYDYAQSGSTSEGAPPPKGTLVVSGNGPSQVFHRYVDPSQPPMDLYFNFRSDGPFLTRVVLHQGAATVSCTFDAPVPAPPWPATTGRSFSGHATCTNGFVADFSGSITGQGRDTVGGTGYDVAVINSTLHARGNVFGKAVDVTVQDTQHWAPALRVPTYSHEVISGDVSGDVTSTLLNASPH